MENLKVWTFHPTTRNAAVFILLSLIFLVLQQSLQSGLPFMNTVFLKKVLVGEWMALGFAVPALYTTIRQRKSSPKYFALYVVVIAFRSLEGLFLDFNKLVLIVLFFHVVISYVFYQLLIWTFSRASFTPNFKSDALHLPMGKLIPVIVKYDTKSVEGRLTNWDSEGAFVWLEMPLVPDVREVEISIMWENHFFEAKGAVVSGTWDGKGIGLEWNQSYVGTEDGWGNLVALFSDYGYEPKLLR